MTTTVARFTAPLLLAALALLLIAASARAAESAAAPPAPGDAAALRAIAREELGIDARVGYTGDRTIESSQVGRTVVLREFRMPGKMRVEFEESGQQIVMILDEAASTAYMMLPALSAYSTLSMQEFQARAWESLDLLDFEKLDRAVVNGHDATRYRVSWRDPEGNQGQGFHWVTDDGVAIRMDVTYDSPEKSGERIVLDLKNLVVGPQDPALFLRPANYLELPSIEGVLGTIQGIGAAPAGSGALDLDALQKELGNLLLGQ